MRTLRTSLLVLGIVVLAGPPASADVATDMAAELQAAGLPGVTVTITTPAPATGADLAAYRDNPLANAPTVTPYNLISPDPTNPQPVATVRFGSPGITELPGLIAPPGGLVPSAEDAESTLWRAEIMAALRRALADGASLAGVAMQPAGEDAPDMWLTPPDPDYAPAVRLIGTRPLSEVESAIEETLPLWARAATVSVADLDPEQRELGSERRVRLTLPLDPLQFILGNGQSLVPHLLAQQLDLNQSGGGIGQVSLELTDPSTAAPLFVYAGDATFGQNFHWVSPIVAAWVGRVPGAPSDELLQQLQGDVESTVDGALSEDPPLVP